MENLDVLTGEPREEQAEQVENPTEQPQAAPEGGETTAPNGTEDSRVPLAALEAVRGEKNDWKGKALRYEGELEAYRRQQVAQANSQPQEQQERNPFEVMQERILNERFNTSEMIARQAHADIDEKIDVFKEAMAKNPALYAQMQQQTHPWEFAYKEGARMLLQKEMGDDPTAYKSKLEAEIRAKILAENGLSPQGQAPEGQDNRPKLPASLAGARSTAARSAPSWTGPTPFDNVVNRT